MHSTVDSVRFQHLAPAQRSFLLSHSSVANARGILDSKQEPAHEERQSVAPLDHLLRRSWSRLTLSSKLQQHETARHARLCPSTEVAKWSPSGAILGKRPSPVVSSTVRDAAGNLAASFLESLRTEPRSPRRKPSYPPSSP
jgi:hypothetical protein